MDDKKVQRDLQKPPSRCATLPEQIRGKRKRRRMGIGKWIVARPIWARALRSILSETRARRFSTRCSGPRRSSSTPPRPPPSASRSPASRSEVRFSLKRPAFAGRFSLSVLVPRVRWQGWTPSERATPLDTPATRWSSPRRSRGSAACSSATTPGSSPARCSSSSGDFGLGSFAQGLVVAAVPIGAVVGRRDRRAGRRPLRAAADDPARRRRLHRRRPGQRRGARASRCWCSPAS